LGCSRAKIVGTNNVAYYVKIAFALLHFALSISLLITGYLRYDAQEPSLYMGLSAFVFGSALSVCLVHAEHFRNIVSSSVLVVYWLLVFLSCVIRLRTYVSVADYSLSYFILLCAYTSLCLVQVALQHCASNTKDGYTAIEQDSFNDDGEHEHHLTPEETSGFFTILTFSWMNDLMKKGYQRPLEEQDLPDLQNQYKSRNVSRDFEYYWQQELKKNNPSLLWAFVRCYGPSFAFAGLFKLAQDSLAFLQPQFLKLLMKFIDSWNPLVGSQEKQSEFVGFLICLLMLITAWTQSWMLHQYFHMCLVVGMKIRAATVTAVYRKGLKLSNSSRQTFTAGEIVNHQSVDAQRFQDLMGYLHLLWSGPFQIALALYFLYQELGPSLFAGVSFMLIMIPLNTWLANLDARYEKEQMENKDRRMKFIDEALNGIKILKFYAWEKIFDKKITEVRDKELAVLKSLGVVNAFQSFAWACAPFFVTFFSFTTYIFVGDAPLTSQKVFSSIALFNLLQFPMSIFPYVISSSVQAGISLKRVHRYLTSENLSKYVGRKEFSEKLPAVEIVNDSFSWEKNGNPILSNITLKLQRKSITAVIGKVGCGKSSLVSAILEEMCTVGVDCSVLVSGSVAYVGQQAWIMNASFRDNILFGKPYDKEFYEKVLYSCALIPDLKILPAGDLTEIGEKGINLSGG
jgi:ABC-type multidrug transport system fused ATPase/permease subunit